MVRELNMNKREELKNDLRNHFPELTSDELNNVDHSLEQLADSISNKTQKDKSEIEKLLVDKLEFINSKHLI